MLSWLVCKKSRASEPDTVRVSRPISLARRHNHRHGVGGEKSRKDHLYRVSDRHKQVVLQPASWNRDDWIVKTFLPCHKIRSIFFGLTSFADALKWCCNGPPETSTIPVIVENGIRALLVASSFTTSSVLTQFYRRRPKNQMNRNATNLNFYYSAFMHQVKHNKVFVNFSVRGRPSFDRPPPLAPLSRDVAHPFNRYDGKNSDSETI